MQLLRGQLPGRWQVDGDIQLPDPKFRIAGALSIPSGPLPPSHPVLLQEISQFKKETVPTLTERADCPILEPPTHPSCLSLVLPFYQSCHFRRSACQERKFYRTLCERKTPLPFQVPHTPGQTAPPLNRGGGGFRSERLQCPPARWAGSWPWLGPTGSRGDTEDHPRTSA